MPQTSSQQVEGNPHASDPYTMAQCPQLGRVDRRNVDARHIAAESNDDRPFSHPFES
jgi:hypothetical protein